MGHARDPQPTDGAHATRAHDTVAQQAEPEDRALLIEDLRQELDDTNRGLIALHTELETARRAEARLAAIVASSDDAMISVDPVLRIQTWNPGAGRLLGHTEQHLVGQKIDTLMPGPALDAFQAAVEQIRSHGHADSHQSRWRRADDTVVDVAVTVSAMRDADGALIGYSTTARDITHQLAAQTELTTARADREVLAERDRIARDLHDLVIQRLFASGLTLQSALARLTGPTQGIERVERVMNDLDDTIKTIRTTIYALRETHCGQDGRLRTKLLAECEQATEPLGFAPALRMDGLLETRVPGHIADHLLAVLREALSNTARHARATVVDVSIEVTDTSVRLTVADNGRGIDPAVTRSSGLSNLRTRAQELGGTFSLTPNQPHGAILDFSTPLPADG
ncbi:PAS domain-containing sensor histidine kinase [Streptomyces blattellae]|uniref:PAS domain-containing sensor histidine kinase n=1 Tax=Streptomyces blattellae TaxID=2569855 RepID=UPI0018ACFEC0|nr:PAS domain-containing sensor histidine kinase [Streptomyces blattellae]